MTLGNLHNNIHPAVTVLIIVLIMLLLVFLISGWQSNRLYFYSIARESAKYISSVQTFNLSEIKGENFVVKYYPGDQQQAQLVLEAAEQFITPVSTKLGYQPKGKITVVVYPSREQLNKFFGWPADESAMGVYWSGTIRVLAPREWVGTYDSAEAKELFFSSGPMAHEIAHLVVDYRTKGNYNRWFTEGIAQYLELQLTGFRFNEPAGALNKERYTLEQLTNQYDQLPNQSLAYRQSLAAVYYLATQYGEENLTTMLTVLGQGHSMDEALQQVYGIDLKTFEVQLNNWLDTNWNVLS